MDGLNPIWFAAALLLASGVVGAMVVLSPKSRPAFVYAQLVLMAGIYIGFAISYLDAADFVTRAHWSALVVESFIAIGFLLGGLALLQSSRPWLLGAMILAHGGVDLVHLLIGAGHSPDWYEFLCILYDAIVGVAAIWLLSDSGTKNSTTASSL